MNPRGEQLFFSGEQDYTASLTLRDDLRDPHTYFDPKFLRISRALRIPVTEKQVESTSSSAYVKSACVVKNRTEPASGSAS